MTADLWLLCAAYALAVALWLLWWLRLPTLAPQARRVFGYALALPVVPLLAMAWAQGRMRTQMTHRAAEEEHRSAGRRWDAADEGIDAAEQLVHRQPFTDQTGRAHHDVAG